jgi:D-sedoheptulose 7-phosphate isomerase
MNTDYLNHSLVALQTVADSLEICSMISKIADAIAAAVTGGGKLLIIGNGGSAACAQHLAAEFLSRFILERQPLPALALTADTSVLTAISNDYGYSQVFVRQVHGIGRPGDVLLALSTSGHSPNVLAALTAARKIGMKTIGLTGEQGFAMQRLCDLCLTVPFSETAIIQQIHMVVGHMICELVEQQCVVHK